jgi:hemerythrin-like metal-binding protein
MGRELIKDDENQLFKIKTQNKNTMETLDDNLLFNIDVIDAQHKKLFELFEKLLRLNCYSVDFELILASIVELDECFCFHFETEEKLMKNAGVDDLKIHLQQHNSFKKIFREFRTLSESKSHILNRLSVSLAIDYLKKWFSTHIQYSDSLYVDSVQRYLVTLENSEEMK